MDEHDVMLAIDTLEGMGDMVMDRIAQYIKANLDDFVDCYGSFCPQCNFMGWERSDGHLECENGHLWFPKE